MYNIKFTAVDIEGKIIYCYYRDTSENKKNPGIERTFPFDEFIEKESRLKEMLEGDVYSIYLQDSYTEKKSLDGTFIPLEESEIEYITDIVKKACITFDYDDLLNKTLVDDQIDKFIKEFFDKPTENQTNTQDDFLAQFFKDIEDSEEKKS